MSSISEISSSYQTHISHQRYTIAFDQLEKNVYLLSEAQENSSLIFWHLIVLKYISLDSNKEFVEQSYLYLVIC
jgi:hypothetical protein